MAENDMPETQKIIASALLLPLAGRISLLNAALESVEQPAAVSDTHLTLPTKA